MPMECRTKSSFPPNISVDLEKRFSRSSIEVASAAITSDPHLVASSLMAPILNAIGALESTNSAPSSLAFRATFHAIDFSSKAPNMIPLFPFNKL